MSRTVWLPVVAAFVSSSSPGRSVVVVGGLPPFILPPPETVAERFVEAWPDGTIWPHFATTLVEIAARLRASGPGSGSWPATGSRAATSSSGLASPYLVAAQAVPILALAPLLVFWFGPGLLEQGRHLRADRLLPGRRSRRWSASAPSTRG